MAKKFKSVRQLLSSPGKWMKGDFDNGHGAHCLLGGINRVYLDQDMKLGRADVVTRVCKAIRKLYRKNASDGVLSIITFNDNKATKFKDIQKVLREAKI